jgi:Gnt-I system high-affinity gluconate transporter
VIIIALSAIVAQLIPGDANLNNIVNFISDPVVVMLLAVLITSYTLGLKRGRNMVNLMQLYTDAIKDISSILLIIGTAGILKQIFIDGGVSAELAAILKGWDMPILFLSWAITAVLRVALGSATIAGLTAVGIVYPLSLQTTVDPSLMVLAVGAGSLFCSHVNDTAFWLFKEYFGLSIKDTFRSWTVMETLVSIIGLFGVLALDFFLKA